MQESRSGEGGTLWMVQQMCNHGTLIEAGTFGGGRGRLWGAVVGSSQAGLGSLQLSMSLSTMLVAFCLPLTRPPALHRPNHHCPYLQWTAAGCASSAA